MAKFNATGIEGLSLDMKTFLSLSDEMVDKILMAQGEVVAAAQKKSIAGLGLVDTGKLRDSITILPKVRNRKRYVIVYPQGNHGQAYLRKTVTKAYARSKSGRTYTYGGDVKKVTNQDVGFVHEFGAPGRHIPASLWMKKANDSSEPASNAAGQAVLDEYLTKSNL